MVAVFAFPQTFAEIVRAFGVVLFDQGHALYTYRHLLAHLQREDPARRQHFSRCWQLVSRWQRLEPIQHRSPVPYVLVRAIVSVALLWGWQRVACVVLLCFFGLARPGEVLQARRRDLLLPRDLVAEAFDAIYLKVVKPKTRYRGLGMTQHIKIQNLLVAKLCERVLGDLPLNEPLYKGSPSTFRRRWDAILAALQVPVTLRVLPAGLRGGGSVWAYRQNEELQRILWRMRLSNMITLQHYLQEVGADSIYLQLAPRTKELVQSANSLFEILAAHFS